LNPTIRSIASLQITLNEVFSLTPLDANGNVIAGGRVLYFPDVFPYMTYAPDAAIVGNLCNPLACYAVPATVNNSAYDGFSIPVMTLRALSPANGYAITVDYTFTLPTPTISANQGLLSHHDHTKLESRKLLQTTGPDTSTIKSGQFTFNFVISDTGNTNTNAADPNTVSAAAPPIQGLQCQVHVYVDTATFPTALPLTDQVAVTAYLEQQLPPALAVALDVNVNQITNLAVLLDTNQVLVCSKCQHLEGYTPTPPTPQYQNDTSPLNSKSRWMAYEKSTNSLKTHHAPVNRMRSNKIEAYSATHTDSHISTESSTTTLSSTPAYYVTFVLIASPTPGATVVTAASLTQPDVRDALQVTLQASGVSLAATPIQVVNVLTTPTTWFLGGGSGGGGSGGSGGSTGSTNGTSIIVIPIQTVTVNASGNGEGFGMGLLWVFLFVVGFASLVSCVRYWRRNCDRDGSYTKTATDEIVVTE
jgi:hypothetical protein